MILLDGKLTSEKIKEEIKIEVQEIVNKLSNHLDYVDGK